VPHESFRLGVPNTGRYQLLLNSDATQYGGSGFEVNTLVATEKVASEGLPQSLKLRVPPLATLMYKLID
ncbi:alpha amylase C-terminal domain-containing protein, partial [Vibrio furnissii]